MFASLLRLVSCGWVFEAEPGGPNDVPVYRCWIG